MEVATFFMLEHCSNIVLMCKNVLTRPLLVPILPSYGKKTQSVSGDSCEQSLLTHEECLQHVGWTR